MSHPLPLLPPQFKDTFVELETKVIMREVSKANRKLAELKGYAEIVPNKNILINAIMLNEAKESSEIENIITTHDELFAAISKAEYLQGAAKEVINYKEALWTGIDLIKQNGFLSTNMIVSIQAIIEGNRAGIRTQGGTRLINDKTGEIVYTPPSTEVEIRNLLGNLEYYVNNDDEMDPLIKLAVIHYQFESIHPFYDGNGRTGRIINELYLVMKGLLDSPILYLSKYILSTKEEYYKRLNNIHNLGQWEQWIIYILRGVQHTSEESLRILKEINALIDTVSHEIKSMHPKIYSKELVDILFSEFYTRITNIEQGLNITRKTASGYLNTLVDSGILTVDVRGKEKLFINHRLIRILKEM